MNARVRRARACGQHGQPNATSCRLLQQRPALARCSSRGHTHAHSPSARREQTTSTTGTPAIHTDTHRRTHTALHAHTQFTPLSGGRASRPCAGPHASTPAMDTRQIPRSRSTTHSCTLHILGVGGGAGKGCFTATRAVSGHTYNHTQRHDMGACAPRSTRDEKGPRSTQHAHKKNHTTPQNHTPVRHSATCHQRDCCTQRLLQSCCKAVSSTRTHTHATHTRTRTPRGKQAQHAGRHTRTQKRATAR
jgi:hypothetical protein